ncbi:MAG: ATP-dependent helicase HrpB [Isosphaeraceae bacterium]
MNVLPIDALVPEIIASLRLQRCLVLIAPPGAGKTTRVPPAILKAGLLNQSQPALVMLQPRRVAARSSAARIAVEQGGELGREVGYQVRFERRIGPETRLRVVTEGILTRQILADPFLEGVGAVVLDEFHERGLHSDLALALVREVRDAVRPDLIVVVMSATLDAGPVARFLGNCPVLRAEGRTFPVEISYQPRQGGSRLPEQVGAALDQGASSADPGDVLVFLPGADEIRRTARHLAPLAEREHWLVLPLHGSLPAEDQDRALRPADRRKVVLATNVAETSLTIEGVSTVIDSGLARFASHDSARGLDRLVLGRISLASAAQRAGRAGRTGPGRCIRLWSQRDERGMPEFDEPEIRRVDLAGTLLTLHAWGQADPGCFGWYEAPPPESIAGAERLLVMLGALEAEGGSITPIGRRLAALPVHPRLGRLILAAALAGLRGEGAALAALLSEKDILNPPEFGPDLRRPAPGRGRSDLLVRLDLLAEAEHRRFAPSLRSLGIDPNAARRVSQASDDLRRLAKRLDGPAERAGEADEETLLRLIVLAYPDRVARRRSVDPASAVMVGGRGVRLAPESVVREPELFLALDPREARRGATLEARVRIASEVQADWLEEFFPDAVVRDRSVHFDEHRGRAVALDTVRYRDLILRQDDHGAVSAVDASTALAEALGRRALAFVREDQGASSWLDRLDFLRTWLPETPWPVLGDAELAEVVAIACVGRRTVDAVKSVPLVPLLKGLLTHAQGRLLDEQAPETLTVPSGNRLRLSYGPGRPPILSARIQELFGWTETPRVALNRVPVVLHLLGPHFRPVQITDDLRSFWATTYHQVRKDLRARYPRHSWPDDPLTAKAESKGRPRP